MGFIQRQTDDIDKLPRQGEADRPPWQTPPPAVRWDFLSLAVLCLFVLLCAPLAYWLLAPDIRAWVRYGDGATWIYWTPRLIAVLVIAFALKHWLITEQPGGVRVSTLGTFAAGVRAVLDVIEVQRVYAANGQRNVRAQTFAPTYHHEVGAADQLALPAPEDAIGLTPDSDWLRWIDRTPHLLIAGKTDAGKTTFASAVLAERVLAGDRVLVLDPHWQPGKWSGVQAIADIPAILEILPALIEEMRARYEEFKAGKPTEDFERYTIIVDEVPAIVDACFDHGKSGRPRLVDGRWPRFARILGSEARAVRMSAILLTQSTLVQDALINTQMRSNFTRVGLGDQARPLLTEESDNKKREQLYDLLRGQAHPAAMEYKGNFYLLDTSNVEQLARRSIHGRIQPWRVDSLPAHNQNNNHNHNGTHAMDRSGLSVLRANAKPPFSGDPQGADRPDRRQTEWDRAKKLAVLRAMRAKGMTRNEARGKLASIGQGFDNDDWTEAWG